VNKHLTNSRFPYCYFFFFFF